MITEMDTMTPDTDDTLPRNTNMRGKCWGPNTWNNYTPNDLIILEKYAIDECIDYAINQEVGENGTPHLQFCLKFKNARAFNSLKNKFPSVHWEKSKNWNATLNYCKKSETAIAEPIIKEFVSRRRPLKDPLLDKTLRDFQKEILDICETEADDRTIVWIYDPTGNAGKTTLAKHLCIKRPNEILYLSGKSSDMKYGVTCFLDQKTPDKKDWLNDLYVCLIDLTRSVENFVSYEGIESVKNGIFYNTKFESKMVIFNNPHVIVFANFLPDFERLSEDRWKLIEL